MSNSSDLDFLKDIPGYKAIMKSVIKSQIQLLIEQLSDQTGEESIILTASINEGTLSHLGSNMGKGFFEGRDEIKSQFLGYCLKNHHNSRDDLLPRTLYQEDNISDRYQPSLSAKRQKVQAVSLPRKDQDYEVPGMQQSYQSQSPQGNPLFVPRTPTRVPTKKRPASSTSTPTQNSPIIPLNTDNNSVVKAERTGDTEDTDTAMRLPIVSSSEIAEHPANIPHPVRLSHAQSHPPVGEETDPGGQLKDPDPSRLAHTGDDSQGPIVKMEPDMENENDLEITGVETSGMAPSFSGDWGQDVSGGMGYMPSESGDSSFDQLGGHQNLEALSKPIPSRSCFKTNVEKRTGPNNQMLTQCVIEKENIEEVARAMDQDAVVAKEDSVDSAYHIQTPNEADDKGLNNGITQDLTLSHTFDKGGKENEQSTEVFMEVATNLDTNLSDDRIGSKDNLPEHENIQQCNKEAQVLLSKEKGDDHGNSSNVESDSHIVDINKKAVTQDQHDFNQELQVPYGVKTFLHADTPKLIIQLERIDDNSSKKVNTKSSAVDEMCFSNRKFIPKTRGHKMEKDTTPQKKETVSLIATSIRKLDVLGEPNEMKDRPKDEKNRIKGHTGELICHICRKSFTCASKLQEHILMHTGEKHCLCCKCGKRFKNRSGNTIHRMRCGKVVYNAWFKRLIKGNQCQVCNRQFKFLSQLLVHYGVHNSEDYMKFKPQVKKQNVDARQTKASMAIVNKRLSNSKGKNPVSIPKEGKKVHSINDQTCHICRKPFNSLSNLLEHIVVHTGDQNFSCSKCRKKFKWRVVAKYHSRSCDGEIIWRYRGLKSGSSKQCSICERKFKLWTRLLIHIGKHEKAKTKHLKTTYQKPSRKDCYIYGKEFQSSKSLQDHILVHSVKIFRCVKCDKKFKSAKGKKLHETKCDGGKQELKADVRKAASTCKTQTNLSADKSGQSEDKEVSNSNTIDVDYTCHICKKRFRNITKLHEHLTVHTGEKNFACSKCGARYKWRGLARAHIQSCGGKIIWKVRYTGIKRGLDCKLCSKKFQYQSQLLIHMSEHGADTEYTIQEKTEAAKAEQNNSKNEIRCKICHRDFMSDSQLQQHLMTHSNIKPFSCSWCLMRFKCEDSLQQHQVHFCPERKLALSK